MGAKIYLIFESPKFLMIIYGDIDVSEVDRGMFVLKLFVAQIVISIEAYDISSRVIRRPLWASTHA